VDVLLMRLVYTQLQVVEWVLGSLVYVLLLVVWRQNWTARPDGTRLARASCQHWGSCYKQKRCANTCSVCRFM